MSSQQLPLLCGPAVGAAKVPTAPKHPCEVLRRITSLGIHFWRSTVKDVEFKSTEDSSLKSQPEPHNTEGASQLVTKRKISIKVSIRETA